MLTQSGEMIFSSSFCLFSCQCCSGLKIKQPGSLILGKSLPDNRASLSLVRAAYGASEHTAYHSDHWEYLQEPDPTTRLMFRVDGRQRQGGCVSNLCRA